MSYVISETKLTDHGNVREQLAACESWLGDQDETFSDGLRSPEDALKLYRYALANDHHLAEYAEDWHKRDLIAAIGYDPRAEVSP